MNKSVYDVIEKDIHEWLDGTQNRLLLGGCADYNDYLKCSERMLTVVKLLDIIKEALQRLEKEQNE